MVTKLKETLKAGDTVYNAAYQPSHGAPICSDAPMPDNCASFGVPEAVSEEEPVVPDAPNTGVSSDSSVRFYMMAGLLMTALVSPAFAVTRRSEEQ